MMNATTIPMIPNTGGIKVVSIIDIPNSRITEVNRAGADHLLLESQSPAHERRVF
jgi:hypothetical protein